MGDVFDVLGADHRAVKQMLAELEVGPMHGSGDDGNLLAQRKQTAETLIIESSKHEAAEEQYFWPTVRDRVPDGDRLADRAISQEDEAKEMLARLEKADPGESEFDDLIASYVPAAREHIAYEEETVWPLLRDALSAAEAEELGSSVADAEKSAPTRPHPHTPASPGILRTAGPAVAAADKLRDSMSGRGEK
jgi:hemerythrin superfamily protein